MAVAIVLAWSLGGRPAGSAPSPSKQHLGPRDPEIDVLLTSQTGETVAFSAPGGWVATAADGREVARTTSSGEALVARAGDGTLTLRGAPVGAARFEVAPLQSQAMRIGRGRYRGRATFEASPQGVRIVNRVRLESYLASVVGSEMFASSTKPAALEAQAIAARTYARWEIETRGRSPLPDGTQAQMYLGVERETDATRAAVLATAHQVLVYEHAILPAFYHSTCGGWTVDGSELLGAPAPAPLRGVPCGACDRAKFYRWRVNVAAPLISAAAVEARVGLPISRLEPAGPRQDPWSKIVLIGGSGAVTLPAHRFRTLLLRQKGGVVLPSPFFSNVASDRKAGIVIAGRGFGHGVGMCQMGAAAMAARGSSAEEILGHYYPQARVVSTEDRPFLALR